MPQKLQYRQSLSNRERERVLVKITEICSHQFYNVYQDSPASFESKEGLQTSFPDIDIDLHICAKMGDLFMN